MATPSGSPVSMGPSEIGKTEHKDDNGNYKKRNLDALDDSFDDGMWDLNEDGRPKTRRVNPQRLAIRLGPDLVAEMEALIIPGAKMPNFTVRKDFQERYNVDRRHIYDYFHSRGLRVAKEDKHTNLIRGRAMKAQAQAQAQAQALQQQAISKSAFSWTEKDDSLVVAKQESEPSDVPKSSPSLVDSTTSLPKARVKRPYKIKEKKNRVSRGPNAHLSKTLKPAAASNFLVAHPIAGECSGPFLATSSSGTDTDWDSASTCPNFTLPCDSSDENTERTSDISDFLNSPDDFVVGYFDNPPEHSHALLDAETSATCDLDLDSLMTLDEHYPLNQEERTELYDLINNNIPRTPGLEASVGTYDSYMYDKPHSYFDCLLPTARANRSWKAGTQVNNSSMPTCDPPISVDIPDIRAWLSDDLLYPPASVLEYNPICDNFGENIPLDGVPLDLVTGETGDRILLDSLVYQQSYNQALSGKVLKDSERLSLIK